MTTRRGAVAACLVAVAAFGLASSTATPAQGTCSLDDHRVNVYETTIAAAVVDELNERRAALGRAPLGIHPELWLRAMWRGGRTAASGAPGVSGPDPCPGPAPLLEAHLRRLGPPLGTATVIEDPVITDTGRLEVLLAASTRSVGIGIAYGFSHTISVVYASDAASSSSDNEPPQVRSETLPFTPATPPHDLAPALLANDGDDQGLVHVVAAEADHGTTGFGRGGVRGLNLFYVPDRGHAGPDTLRYTVADVFGTLARGEATLVVCRAAPRPRLTLTLGVRGGRVPLERLAGVDVTMTVAVPGAVTLVMTRGERRIGATRRFVDADGVSVPLRTLFRDGVRRGRYALTGLYRGTRTVLRFAAV
jgi:hypothetical protein